MEELVLDGLWQERWDEKNKKVLLALTLETDTAFVTTDKL